MVLSVEQLKNSLDKVQKMASDVKNPLGILLKKEGTDVHVCYSDGKKAMVDVIEAQDTTGLDADVILPYKQFIDIIGSYANSGELSLAVCLFYLVCCRGLTHAQHLVIISFFHISRS